MGSPTECSHDLSAEELAILKEEQALSALCGMEWQERGPLPQHDGPPGHWRGQAYRAGWNGGKPRYGNRGGRNKELYKELARQGRVGIVKGKGKDKDQAIGKGSSKGASSSSGSSSSFSRHA